MSGTQGKVVAITGASGGIGEATALLLAERGAKVVLGARRTDRLKALATRIAAAGGEAVHACTDVKRRGDLTALVALARERFGKLDVFVNNAGIGEPMPAESEPMGHFRQVVDVNLNAVFQLCQLAFRPMVDSSGGSIVNVASMLGLIGSAPIKQASYCASKGAVVNLTRELGCQWARKGVRVNALAPGWFPSEMTADMWTDPSSLAYVERNTPMARGGRVDELDGALLFLAGDASSFVTGQTLVVDGGWSAR